LAGATGSTSTAPALCGRQASRHRPTWRRTPGGRIWRRGCGPSARGRRATMPDERWPREREADREPLTSDYWAFSPTIRARDVKEVPVYVPLRPNGTPDLDGLLARLRLDPAEVERDRQRVAEALTQVERLKTVLRAINGGALVERGGKG